MRIVGVEARHFGAIGGRSLELPGGLVVLHGPNESGKSSTLDLIRGVLFEFTPARRLHKEPVRLPIGATERSGVVVVERPDGSRIRIERVNTIARVTDEEGRELGDAALHAALGGLTPSLFADVLTFSERDLAQFSLLDGKEVRSGILGAAAMGAGIGIGRAVDQLGEAARQLHAPRGRTTALNECRNDLKAARERLRAASDRVADHAALLATVEEAGAEGERLRAEERELAAAVAECERALRLRERLDALTAAEHGLAALTPPDDLLVGPAADAIRLLDARRDAFEDAVADRDSASARSAEAQRSVDESRQRLGLAGEPAPPTIDQRGALSRAAQAALVARAAAEERRAALSPAPVAVAPPAPSRLPLVFGIAAGVSALLAVIAMELGRPPLTVLLGVFAVLFAGAAVGTRGRVADAPRADDPAAPAAAPGLADERRDEAERAWAQALAAVGLDGVAPDDAAAILDEFDRLAQAQRTVAAEREAAARAAERASAWLTEARAALTALGIDAGDGEAGIAVAVRDAAERAAADQGRAEEFRIEAAARTAAVEQARSAIDGDEVAIAGARALDADAARAEAEHAAARLADLRDGELRAADERYFTAVEAVRAIEASADVATAAQEVARLEEAYRALADRWLTLRLAEHIAIQARDRYVAERQPDVIRRAGERIRAATDGAWQAIVLGEGDHAGEQATILRRDGHAMPVSELSVGAVGLVYLCIRIGLVEQITADRHEALPIVMDDVLTHLDPEREAGAARLIAELAEDHQVIYLTCHERQVEALRAARPDLHELRLERLV